MPSTHKETHEAMLAAIKHVAEDALNQDGKYAAVMVREAAMAYRMVVGGPQPGGVPVSE